MMNISSVLYSLPGFNEPFSAISHMVGVVLFVFLGAKLLRRGGRDPVWLASLTVYAVACVLLLSMSTVYHMVPRGGGAHVALERLDHGAIFVLIAGTFTPTLGMLFRGWVRRASLVFIWTAAVTGITLKTIFFDDVPEWLGLSLYLGMGWFGVFFAAVLMQRYSFAFIAPLLWGGIAYSIGSAFDYARWPTVIPGVIDGHEVFHVAVIIGAIFHWVFIWRIANGRTPETRFDRRRRVAIDSDRVLTRGTRATGVSVS
jgi:channel protein (hemolysin III family)